MIVKITEGGSTPGLVNYLVGPGKVNEHTEPHVVAGSDVIVRRWGAWESLSAAQGYEIARFVDQFMSETGVRPRGDARVYNQVLGEVEVVKDTPNHVWHCSLSLPAEEAALSDEKWRAVATDFMTRMGFTGADGKAPCRWVAVHHGVSKNGNDHIHICANVVREDGTKWSPWRDKTKASRAVNFIEHKYGLRVIEAREHQRGARANSKADLAAAREGATDKDRLETRVRAAAVSARSESDFVYRLAELGVRARPRFAAGRTDVVVGYSVALHSYDQTRRAQWYAGGQVARDLALPRLRARWADTPQDASRAARAWRRVWEGAKVVAPRAHVPAGEWQARAVGLRAFRDVLARLDASDPVALADATRDVAGLLAAAALQRGNAQERSVLERASRAVGRHCQTHSRQAPPSAVPGALALAAQTLSLALTDQSADSLLLVVEVMALVRSLAALHAQQAQTETARVMLRDTVAVFSFVHAVEVPLTAAEADQRRYVELVGRPVTATEVLPEAEPTRPRGPSDLDLEAAGLSRQMAERLQRIGALAQGGRAPAPRGTVPPPAPAAPARRQDRSQRL